MLKNTTLVLHFNAFNGVLMNGYFMSNGARISAYLTREQVLRHLAEHPDTRCDPLKV